MLPFPYHELHKAIFKSRMKTSNTLVRIYLHNERHERSYGEVKLWLVFAKIFPKPQTYGKKVEETEVNAVLLFNFPSNSW